MNDLESVLLFVLLCGFGIYVYSLGRRRFLRCLRECDESRQPSGYGDPGRPHVADAIGDTLIDEIRMKFDGLPPLPRNGAELRERSGYVGTTLTLVKRS